MGLLSGMRDVALRLSASTVVYPQAVFFLKTGNWDRAKHRLGWIIRNHPRHFGSHVQLGRLYLRQGNRVQALRLLNQARWIDPFRFERTELPREVHVSLGRDPMFTPHDLVIESRRSRGSDPRTVDSPTSRRAERRAFGAGEADLGGDLAADGSTFLDSTSERPFRYRDFSSVEEYRRFRELPPITPEDARSVDWDSLFDDRGA